MDNCVKITGSFDSTNSVNKIAYYIIAPQEKPIAVLQFCHGMAEHSGRYEDFGRFFASQGIAFCITDHIGHGESISSQDDLGYFGKKDGWKTMVEDAKKFTLIVKEKYKDVPYFIAGHSMGSFVARSYISSYSDLVDGAVIIGTGNATPTIYLGTFITRMVTLFKGERYRSKFLDKLSFGAYNKRIESVKTPSDWLSRDEDNVDKYIKDPLCGFIFTASGYRDVTLILRSVSNKKWASGIRKNLPIFIISGEADPVGEYGEGVKKVYHMLKESGIKDVVMKLYGNDRHEILNEKDKKDVYTDILAWLLAKIG